MNASMEEHIGTTAKKEATPVNTEVKEQAAIKADKITASTKTGEEMTAHNGVDQETFASVVRAQEEVSAIVAAADCGRYCDR